MKSILRNCFALLFAAMLALPTTGSEGGENAGGNGVWILPCCFGIGVPIPVTAEDPRMTITAPNTSGDVRLQVSNLMSQAQAVFVDGMSGLPVPVPVEGKVVVVPAGLLQALQNSSNPTGTLLISDDNQLGYLVAIRVCEDGSVTLTVE